MRQLLKLPRSVFFLRFTSNYKQSIHDSCFVFNVLYLFREVAGSFYPTNFLFYRFFVQEISMQFSLQDEVSLIQTINFLIIF